jgi:two-component system response regulator ChvI
MPPDEVTRSRPKRLVVVDDDALFLRVFSQNLTVAGYVPLCFSDPAAALAALAGGAGADACVLDLAMPGLDGLAFLRALAEQAVGVPVMVLTSHTAPMFEEEALRCGALDFVDKSRGPAIILQRLALLTRPGREQDAAAAGADLKLGALLLSRQTRRAHWNGSEVPLSRTEFDVVLLLAGKPGLDVGYREIYDVMKGDGFISGSGEDGYRTNVRAAIKRLRRKFEQIDSGFAALENYPGFGYRWRGDE